MWVIYYLFKTVGIYYSTFLVGDKSGHRKETCHNISAYIYL